MNYDNIKKNYIKKDNEVLKMKEFSVRLYYRMILLLLLVVWLVFDLL